MHLENTFRAVPNMLMKAAHAVDSNLLRQAI